MDKNQLHDLFATAFDYARFIPFCVEVLGINRCDLSIRPNDGTPIIYDEDKNEVLEAHVVATVERNNRKMGILIYDLSTKTTITRTIGLRKLVNPLVKWDFDAVIAVFRIKGKSEWRLSFIENLPKDERQHINARRYTYVFGHADELYRTPINNFLDLQKEPYEKKGYATYKEAFSVEALSNRFFKAYKKIYEDFVEEISGKRYVPVKGKSNTFEEKETHVPSSFFASAFSGDGKSVRDYVKKMMGRLVFLQFLQKKGWMGVPKGEAWDSGKGERRYLQRLFAHYCAAHSEESDFNFLEDILEPLFFNALNTERGDDVAPKSLFLTPGKPIRIPFLSGSLFERDALDDKVCRFSRTHFRNLFDLFDQFNFTIDESDPNDAEIGIAPDMLGKIFENLLEDNKDKGAFYTPHEVVQYMCQEALLAYLDERTGLDHALLETLVYKHTFADDRPSIRNAIKDALGKVKICDPAIGSGAFPMGMLHELLACHKALAQENSKSADERRDAFTQIKRHIIANNIYGVDIEQGAVDIARLRFWLSLVIDEKEPTPLPNLDYKIVRGDSLCAMYDGEAINLNKDPGVKSAVSTALEDYQKLVAAFIDEVGEVRVAKRRELNLALLDVLEAYYTTTIASSIQFKQTAFDFVDEQSSLPFKVLKPIDAPSRHMLAKVRALRKCIQSGSSESVPFFDWQVNCSEILGAPKNVNGLLCYEHGFDIVIGNPPYIHFEKAKELGALYGKDFHTYMPRGDIYCLFYEKGLSLLREGGILCYITSNKWMRAGYGVKLRSFFADHANVRLLLDFAGAKIFETATVDTNILLAGRKDTRPTNVPHASTSRACLAKDDAKKLLRDLHAYVKGSSYTLTFPSDGSSWAILSPIEQSIKSKIEKYGIPLKEWNVSINYGVKTGLNEAFIIDEETRAMLIAQDPKSAEIIRPILRGRDIKRYGYTFAEQWLIATHNGYANTPRVEIDNYPAIKRWLDSFPKLRRRSDKGDTPYNLRDCAYWSLFAQPKLIYPETTEHANFAYDTDGLVAEKTCFILTGEHLQYLQATLSSSLFEVAYRKIFSSIELGKHAYQYNKHALEKLPVSRAGLSNWNRSDEFFYNLYGLTKEEIRYVELEMKSFEKSDDNP